MDIRDVIAVEVMKIILSGSWSVDGIHTVSLPKDNETVASLSYSLADTMLDERNAKNLSD